MECKILAGGSCEITQGFHSKHRGIDMVGAGYTLDDVVAFDDGKVVMSVTGYGNRAGESVNWAYGNFVKILHDDGRVTLYAHLESTNLKVGQRVSKGQFIGRMGNSGNSYGAHLHFELWSNNVYENCINPQPYIAEVAAPEIPYAGKTDEELAAGVWAGEFGNGQDRANALGVRYSAVQALVDQGIGKPRSTPEPIPPKPEPDKLKVGDKVQIIGTGNGSSYGTANTAYGIGWTRQILKIWDGRNYPYQVGNNTGTTGFYKAEALKKK